LTEIFPDRGRKRGYFHNIVMAVDQFIGTLGGIDADESISSYLGRVKYDSFARKAIDAFFKTFFGEDNHCLNSIEKRDTGK